MKKLYFLFFFFSFIVNAQIINIPDANFKAKLLSASSSNSIAKNLSDNYFKIDANNDGEIQITEALQVSWLNVSNSNISSLEGIVNFTNILTLHNNQNLLTTLNLTGLFNLKNLYSSFNNLNTIDLDGLLNLESIYLDSNQFTSFNLNGFTALKKLYINGNDLTSLNLNNLLNLQQLSCYNNLLTSIDLNSLTSLNYVNCNTNFLQSINVNSLYNLQTLNCSTNQLIELFIKNGIDEGAGLNFANNSTLLYVCADDIQISSIEGLISFYGFNNCHVNSYCSFTPNGIFYEISGNTKFDYNSNGCNISDINYSNLIFSITDGINTGRMIANQTGNYYIPVQAGNHTITPVLENPTYFNINPTNFVVNFPTDGSPYSQDFCVTANGVKSDVEVMVLSTAPARPGFDAIYKISYRNKGNQVENGNVSLTFDDAKLDYVSSNPTFDSSATNSFTWNYTNLQPFETREIEVVFNVNSPMETPAINNGDILNYTATITTANTDETPADNTFKLNQTVVGSYDPNDKTCLEGETIEPSMIGEYVHYVIRFENTGTAAAQNIVVKDMIDLANFNISTLVPLKGSHDFITRINGNKVEFIFENINLDFNDAINDGYVAFKIKTLNSLIVGDSFSNDANIYFDYNFPITTNTYTTTIAALNNQNFEFDSQFILYPNPSTAILNIQSKNSLEIQSIEIYNILGQVVVAIPNATNAIDVSSLKTGTYFVKVNTNNGSANTKFVKE